MEGESPLRDRSQVQLKRKDLYVSNPFHNVSIGDNVPYNVQAIIEIPEGSKGKYEIDKPSGLLRLDRILYSAVHYPANYGFIPQTYCDDNDPLDILVLCSIRVETLCIMNARVIGVMRMIDQNEADDKIIAVAQDDPAYGKINDLIDLPPYKQEEVQRFFEDYKKAEKKEVRIEKFEGREAAYKIIEEAADFYNKKYLKPE